MLPLTGDRGFESISLQRRVCELSVPLLSRPEGDVRGIGFQTVRTYIAIGNSEARGAMLARTIFGVAEQSCVDVAEINAVWLRPKPSLHFVRVDP